MNKIMKKISMVIATTLVFGMPLNMVKVKAATNPTVTLVDSGANTNTAKLLLTTTTYTFTDSDGVTVMGPTPYAPTDSIAIDGGVAGTALEVNYDPGVTISNIDYISGGIMTIIANAGGTLTVDSVADPSATSAISTDGNLVIDPTATVIANDRNTGLIIGGSLDVDGKLTAQGDTTAALVSGAITIDQGGILDGTITDTTVNPSATNQPIIGASITTTTALDKVMETYTNATPVAINNVGTAVVASNVTDWTKYTWAPTDIYTLPGDTTTLYAGNTNTGTYTGMGADLVGPGSHGITFNAALTSTPVIVTVDVDSMSNADPATAIIDGVTGASNINIATGKPIVITAPTPIAGMSFDTWTVSGTDTYDAAALGLTDITSPTITVPAYTAGGVNLTANYKAALDYTLIDSTDLATYPGGGFMAMGTTVVGMGSPYTITEGDTVTLTANTIPGFTFANWNDVNGNIVGSTMDMAAGTMNFTMPNSDVNVQAQYTPITSGVNMTYTVTFNDFDGNMLSTETVNDGSMVMTVPTAPERVGYMFAGWSPDGGKNVLDPVAVAAVNVTSDTTYTPVYYMKK